ncbi:MAG: FecR domain-containing protein, partial [Ignavibacteria bacterium]|nr:FecR domain-containing protein [Ignavibacteria bacterium]
MFIWTSTGTFRYRITIDDDIGFYKPLFVSETINTSFMYPQNLFDQRQRLSSSQVYYWKVDGIDSYGNVIANTFEPFSFSIKDAEGTSGGTTADISVKDIYVISISSPVFQVEVGNTGSKTETNINIILYVNGKSSGKQMINTINPGEKKYIDFETELSDVDTEKPIVISVATDFFDDNLKNNIITKSVILQEKYLRKSQVMRVETKEEETITEKKVLTLPGISESEESEEKKVAQFDFFEELKSFLSDEACIQLHGYKLKKINGIKKEEQESIIEQLKEGTAKIEQPVAEKKQEKKIMSIVTDIKGTLNVLPRKELKWRTAEKGHFLYEEDKLRTSLKSQAGIILAVNTHIKLNERTTLYISPVEKTSNEISVRLFSGQIYVEISNPSDFKIEGDFGTVRANSACFSVETFTELTVKVYKGTVEIENNYGKIVVPEGKQSKATVLTGPQEPENITEKDTWQNKIEIPHTTKLSVNIKT